MHRAGALLALALALPAHAGDIEVRVEHASRPQAIEGLPVRVLGLTAAREPFTLEGTTDAEGRLRFAEVRSPAAYLISVEFAGATFPGDRMLTFDPERDAADAVKTVAVSIHDPSHDASAIRLESVRWVLDYEAATAEIRQAALLRNDGDRVVVLAADAPSPVSVALAPGHTGFRTPTGLPPPDFELVDGRLDLRGPIAPGPRELVFSYEVASETGAFETELHFPVATPTFELYVRDRGVLIDAGPLHPARPVLDEGGSLYQRYVGFDLAAGERIPLRIRRLERRSEMPPAVLALLAAAGGLVLVLFVGRPVASVTRARSEVRDDAEAAEKEALFAALHDLEHDYETGKLSTEDRDRLREELRREAAQAIARARTAAAAGRAETPAACSCGQRISAGDRFCSGCGRRL